MVWRLGMRENAHLRKQQQGQMEGSTAHGLCAQLTHVTRSMPQSAARTGSHTSTSALPGAPESWCQSSGSVPPPWWSSRTANDFLTVDYSNDLDLPFGVHTFQP
mmetsp:Transcript_13756/g.29596  ORF Transcript_13756/g.29596 Transcript_13756/m.29596 type:complete len:104 (-) Transcript_13756:861-1172(-)|eukprot:CAMPEP_0202890918 /NCGR_PEP_ID=MMETSP1392-20130828/1167_1 /ASSEMBLY_ACC=CAM_ASM_000868 /TAXON_ID=225041 /ORGANISM="Chlamydomonas chlamydogama, Strain SAG 11-48b" /LENGTH=103 /DNA_ID=CAMNT_0049574571 /DNA_START=311 /DNA_END=622 /DNA_ORIENTATION=-